MAESTPTSPGGNDFDFDDVEAFETLLDDNDEAEARRTTWETENYSALVEIEKRLDEAFSSPAVEGVGAGAGFDRTNTVSTARLTPHHADDALVSLARRSSIRLSIRDLGMLGSATQREDSPPNDGTTGGLLSTTVARRTFLRSILGATGAAASPGKRFKNAATSLMRSSRNTRESVCSDSVTTPRGASTTSAQVTGGAGGHNDGLPPTHNTPRTRAASTAPAPSAPPIVERPVQDPPLFVDFVLGRLVNVIQHPPSAGSEGVVVHVLGNVTEAAKLIPVLANYCKRHSAVVVPYLVKKGGALRQTIVPSIVALEQKFGTLDHRISNANGNLLMLLAHESAEIFTSDDIVALVRLDKTQRKHFEALEAASLADGQLLATVTVTQRSDASGDNNNIKIGVSNEGNDVAASSEQPVTADMRQTSVYTSPLIPDASTGAVTTGGGPATFTLQHPRMFRVEWIPPLLSIVCAAKPTRFLSSDVLSLASSLVSDTLRSLVAAEPRPQDAGADAAGAVTSVTGSPDSSRLLLTPTAQQLSAISSELAAATYLVSTISNAFAVVSDPEELFQTASDNGAAAAAASEGVDTENKLELKALFSAKGLSTLFALLLNTTKFLSSIAAAASGVSSDARRQVADITLASSDATVIPSWAVITSSLPPAATTTTAALLPSTLTSAADGALDHKEGITLSCCVSMASSLTAALESFSDAKKRRDDEDDGSNVIDVFEHRGALAEMLIHSLLSIFFLSARTHSSGVATPASGLRTAPPLTPLVKYAREIRGEMMSSLKALLMLPMVMEAVGCLDKADATAVSLFLGEGFANGVVHAFKSCLYLDLDPRNPMALAAASTLDSATNSQLQTTSPLLCETLVPYLLGLEQFASIVGASPVDLMDVSRSAKVSLQSAAVALTMIIFKFTSVSETSQQHATIGNEDDIVNVGTPNKDAANSRSRHNTSNSHVSAAIRELSFSVVRCITILRAYHNAAAEAPGVFVSTAETVQNITWSLQWLRLVQAQHDSSSSSIPAAMEAARSLHSRIVSLLLAFCGNGGRPVDDVLEGVLVLFDNNKTGSPHHASTPSSPCSVIAAAVAELLRPEESILTLSTAKPVVALTLQLLAWFASAPSVPSAPRNDEDDNGVTRPTVPWKFDGITLQGMLTIISMCEEGSPSNRTLAWQVVLRLVTDVFTSTDEPASTARRSLALGDAGDSLKLLDEFFVKAACAQHPSKDVFASLLDVCPVIVVLNAHGEWPNKRQPLSGDAADELLSGITNKLVAAQRHGSEASNTLCIQLAIITRILLGVNTSTRSDWLQRVRSELQKCLVAVPHLEDAALRLWPLTAVLCNMRLGECWTTPSLEGDVTEKAILESIYLLRTNPPEENMLHVSADELDELENAIQDSHKDANVFPLHRSSALSADEGHSTTATTNAAAGSPVRRKQEAETIVDASPISNVTSPTAVSGSTRAKPPLRGDSPLAFVAFPDDTPQQQQQNDDAMFTADSSSRFPRSSSPLANGNMSGSSPRSFTSNANAQDDASSGLHRPASGGSRRRSKQLENPQKLAEDLDALTKSLALKRYQLLEVTTKLKKAEGELVETQAALDNDTYHLEHVRAAIECVDPDHYFSRDEVRRRQKVGDKSIKMLDIPLRGPLPADPPAYDIKGASMAAKKSLDNLSDQFQRLMAAAVDTNDRNKLREAAATLTLERQLFEKEKAFYAKELEVAADIVWKKHSRIYELQLQADDLTRDAEMFKRVKVDFRALEENCTYLKNVLDQYNMHLVAGTERSVTQKRRRASSAHRGVSAGRRPSSANGSTSSPRGDAMGEEDSFEITEDTDEGPVVIPPQGAVVRGSASLTVTASNANVSRPGSRPTSAQPTSARPPQPHVEGGAAHNVTSGTTTPAISVNGVQGKAWSEKMKLEFGLRSANTRIQRLQQEINKLVVERNAAILEAVDARQKTKFVELMHKSDVQGMSWAEQRIRRLEREKEMYVNDTRKAHETLRETAEASQKKIESMQAQLNKVEADRVQVVTTLALELDTARQRITELSGDCRRKDMMITQLTNKLELLRGGGASGNAGNSTGNNNTIISNTNSRANSTFQPSARAMSASPGRAQSVNMTSSPLKKASQGFSNSMTPQPSSGGNSALDNVIDKRQDPHLRNFFAWKDMQRHRRMKQR